MICPNCGKETPEGETCQHCHMSTEFVRVMNCRPEYVPGLLDDEHIKSPPHGGNARRNLPLRGILIHVLISAITILICLLLCLWFFRSKGLEELEVEVIESEEIVTTESLVPEETAFPDQTTTGKEENHG